MKKLFYLIPLCVVLLVSSAILVSCEEDDDPKTNFLNVDGKESDLVQGMIERYGLVSDDIYNNDLILISSGINLTNLEPSGKGNYIWSEMFTSLEADIKPGTYTFSDFNYETQEPEDYTFDAGEVIFGYDVALEDYDVSYTINSGTIKISKEASIYTVEFDWMLKGGFTLKAQYEGTLWVDDNNGDFKSFTLKKTPFWKR